MDTWSIKKIEEITTEYFMLLEDYFGSFYIPGIDKYKQVNRIEKLKRASQMLIYSIDDLQEDLIKFWNKNGENLVNFISKSGNLKVTYCGNISPLDGIDFVKRTALYVDSVLIREPIGYIMLTKQIATNESYLNNIIKHAFNLFDLKKLFFGDGNTPLLIIFPPIFNERGQEDIIKSAEKLGTSYLSELFERDFEEAEEVFEYLDTFNQVEKLSLVIKNDSILNTRNLEINQFLSEVHSNISESLQSGNNLSVGTALGLKIFGQFSNIYTELLHSEYLGSQIMFDRRDYWDLYKQRVVTKPDIDSSIIHSLQLDDFKWLVNLDIDNFNSLRSETEIHNLRSILRRNINNTQLGLSEEKVKKEVLSNIEMALLDHSSRVDGILKELRKKYSLDGLMVFAGVVTGLIPASVSALPILGSISAAYGLYDFVSGTIKKHNEKKEIQKSVMGLLFDAREQ